MGWVRGIRFRITAVAVTALVAVLLTGSLMLVVLQRETLTTALDATLTDRADTLQGLIEVQDQGCRWVRRWELGGAQGSAAQVGPRS